MNNISDTTFFHFWENADRQKGLGLKICGMKYPENIVEVAELQPDYIGFIFHEESSRFFDGIIPKLPEFVKKVGVFVDAKVEFISSKIEKHQLSVVQLHGYESPEICWLLKTSGIEVIKVFSMKDSFDFSVLSAYEDVCDYYLFDTKGKLPGGNGYKFDWDVLKQYPSSKPYFLSGGIGLNEIDTLKEFLKTSESQYCHAIDINSQFELEAGLKDIEKIKKFKKLLT